MIVGLRAIRCGLYCVLLCILRDALVVRARTWTERGSHRLVMLSLVCVSALATPVALQMVSRSGISRTLLIGAVGLVVGAGLLATLRAQSSTIEIVAALSVLGAPFSFNNLGLQAEMTKVTAPAQLGAAAGLFQTARFGGAALAGGLVGVAFAGGANTDGLRQLCVVIVLLSLMLFIRAAQKVVRPRAKEDPQSARRGKRETLENESSN